MFPGQARKAAERFLLAARRANAGQPSPVQSCAAHLASLGLAAGDALQLAYATSAELDAEHTRCFIDPSRSTAHLVWLVDPVAGVSWPLSVVDLLRLVGPRTVGLAANAGHNLTSGLRQES